MRTAAVQSVTVVVEAVSRPAPSLVEVVAVVDVVSLLLRQLPVAAPAASRGRGWSRRAVGDVGVGLSGQPRARSLPQTWWWRRPSEQAATATRAMR